MDSAKIQQRISFLYFLSIFLILSCICFCDWWVLRFFLTLFPRSTWSVVTTHHFSWLIEGLESHKKKQKQLTTLHYTMISSLRLGSFMQGAMALFHKEQISLPLKRFVTKDKTWIIEGKETEKTLNLETQAEYETIFTVLWFFCDFLI